MPQQPEPDLAPVYDGTVSVMPVVTTPRGKKNGQFRLLLLPLAQREGVGAAITAPPTLSSMRFRRRPAQLQEILARDVPSLARHYRNGDWAYRPGDYNGWVPDQGRGIFTKRSFLPRVRQGLQRRAHAADGYGQRGSRGQRGWRQLLAADRRAARGRGCRRGSAPCSASGVLSATKTSRPCCVGPPRKSLVAAYLARHGVG